VIRTLREDISMHFFQSILMREYTMLLRSDAHRAIFNSKMWFFKRNKGLVLCDVGSSRFKMSDGPDEQAIVSDTAVLLHVLSVL